MKFYVKLVGGVVLIILILLLLQWYGDQKKPASAPSPVATATPTPAALTPAPAATPPAVAAAPSLPGALLQNAQRSGYRISSSQFRDDWWYITVIGRDRNHLNDFLDVAQRSGLRNIDEKYQAYKQFISESRTMHQNTFKMRF